MKSTPYISNLACILSFTFCCTSYSMHSTDYPNKEPEQSAKALRSLAWQRVNQGEYQLAEKYLQQAAEQNDLFSCFYLHQCYRHGNGFIAPDEELAQRFKLLRKQLLPHSSPDFVKIWNRLANKTDRRNIRIGSQFRAYQCPWYIQIREPLYFPSPADGLRVLLKHYAQNLLDPCYEPQMRQGVLLNHMSSYIRDLLEQYRDSIEEHRYRFLQSLLPLQSLEIITEIMEEQFSERTLVLIDRLFAADPGNALQLLRPLFKLSLEKLTRYRIDPPRDSSNRIDHRCVEEVLRIMRHIISKQPSFFQPMP